MRTADPGDRQLSPYGTVRERMAGATDGPAAPGADAAALFSRIARGAGLYDLGDDSVHLAHELVSMQWSLGARERRALVLLVLASHVSTRQGNTRLPLGGGARGPLGRLVRSFIDAGDLGDDPAEILRDIRRLVRDITFDRLIGGPGEYRPLIVAGDFLYQQRMLHLEDALARSLRARLDGAAAPAIEPAAVAAAIADIAPRDGAAAALRLSDEQRRAVARAVAQPLTVISGGPGTGKTAIIVALLRVLARLGVGGDQVAVAAPTGKAANRVTGAVLGGLAAAGHPSAVDAALAATPPEARTLHRLLGYLPAADRFRHHDNNPLPAEVVIVDEASMVDLRLMECLLRAVRPDARLVLLGDADQLPSVDAGAVLRDLVAASDRPGGAGFAVRLTRSYRMDPADPDGRAILTAASAVNEGRGRELFRGGGIAVTTPDRLRYRGVERVDAGGAAVEELAESWYRHRVRTGEWTRLRRRTYRLAGGDFPEQDAADLRALLASLARHRILTVTRRHSTGARALNRALHERALADTELDFEPELCPGEPVIMGRNDYDRGLFNGDQGVIALVSTGGGPPQFRAVFPRGDRFAVFHPGAIGPHLELAFAMTVHKSQGSEFDHVAVVLPAADIPLLSRELLYTALTRARRSVAIVGAPAIARAACARSTDRYSGISDKLSGPRREG